MTTEQKIDYLYRKFAEVDGAQSSVFEKEIWRQGDQIPVSCPQFNLDGEYKNSLGELILKRYEYEKLEPIFGFSGAFSSEQVNDIVSFENGFDHSYEYKFYTKSSSGNYVEIPFGVNSYFFDHDSGILFFPEEITSTINPYNLFITFIKYEGLKGLNTSSQWQNSPQGGPTGPTGVTGYTGLTGPVRDYSMRYKGSWVSSVEYGKWDLVEYLGRFYLSTIDANVTVPGTYGWQPFGTPQLSSGFDFPADTFWVSPSFTDTSTCFSSLSSALNAINLSALDEISLVIYPGDYDITSTILMKPGVSINFQFKGRVRVSFQSNSQKLVFRQGSSVKFSGENFSFLNGEIVLITSSLYCTEGSLEKVSLYTNDLSNVSRLILKDSILGDLINYGSFVEMSESRLINKMIIDDSSTTHIFSSLFPSRSLDEPTQEKIEIVSSPIPPGFGLSSPCLLIKNSRIISNAAVFYSGVAPNNPFSLALLNSSFYVKDQSTSFLDLSDETLSYVLNCSINTEYDSTKLRIQNQTDPVFFEYVNATFND